MLKAFSTCFLLASAVLAAPNLLLITVDDMSCDSMGAYGCKLADTSPNMDKLAAEGMRFEYAHVQVGNCYPSRNVMWSGRYPHNSGVEGFYKVQPIDFPVLCDLAQTNGYFAAIRGKVTHSTPYNPYGWDLEQSRPWPHKNAASYGQSTREMIAAAKAAGKPFCYNINISDPHKPFYATGRKGEVVPDADVPSKIFTAADVPLPGFLPNHPDIRTELAQYYSSVRRGDDCLGEILKALEESGEADNTVVMFLSDHGMPLPFAKTAVWHHSTRTPWVVKWPGVASPGAVDKKHMVSAVDMLPTLLDIMGASQPEGLDGRSFLPLIKGESQTDRDFIVKVYNENSGRGRHPMRAVETRDYLYIFNPWSDGKRKFKTATTGTLSYRAMVAMAETDTAVAARLKLFDFREVEELYHVASDPDCLVNLIDDRKHAAALKQLRGTLGSWLKQTGDHCLEAFETREDPAAMSAYVDRKQAEATARRKVKAPKKPAKAKLIRLMAPGLAPGKPIRANLVHLFDQGKAPQAITVTLKNAGGQRIERKVIKPSDNDRTPVLFEFTAEKGVSYSVAAFVGEDYDNTPQHLSIKLAPAKK